MGWEQLRLAGGTPRPSARRASGSVIPPSGPKTIATVAKRKSRSSGVVYELDTREVGTRPPPPTPGTRRYATTTNGRRSGVFEVLYGARARVYRAEVRVAGQLLRGGFGTVGFAHEKEVHERTRHRDRMIPGREAAVAAAKGMFGFEGKITESAERLAEEFCFFFLFFFNFSRSSRWPPGVVVEACSSDWDFGKVDSGANVVCFLNSTSPDSRTTRSPCFTTRPTRVRRHVGLLALRAFRFVDAIHGGPSKSDDDGWGWF